MGHAPGLWQTGASVTRGCLPCLISRHAAVEVGRERPGTDGAVQRGWVRTWPNRVMDTLPLLRFRFVLKLLSDGSWRRPMVFTSGDDGVVAMLSLRKRWSPSRGSTGGQFGVSVHT